MISLEKIRDSKIEDYKYLASNTQLRSKPEFSMKCSRWWSDTSSKKYSNFMALNTAVISPYIVRNTQIEMRAW